MRVAIASGPGPLDPLDAAVEQAAALAGLLTEVAEVTVLLPADAPDEVLAGFGPAVRTELVPAPAPGEAGWWCGEHHAYAGRLYDALGDLFPGGGPDLLEVSDRDGAGAVAGQAAATRALPLRDTTVCVRLHGTDELTSVLDGMLPEDDASRRGYAVERYALRHADRLVYSGAALGTYERLYGADRLAPATLLRCPVSAAGEPADPPPAGPLRLLYLGPLRRSLGPDLLLEALLSSPHPGWELTLAGPDTLTGPIGTSMREQLEAMAYNDERVRFVAGAGGVERTALLAGHHAVVLPGRWDAGDPVALHALAANRPAIVAPARGGAAGLQAMLDPLLQDPAAVLVAISRQEPRRRGAELADPETTRAAYVELAGRRRPAVPPVPRPPAVSMVVNYFHLEDHIEETLASVMAQTLAPVETIVVNDGSFRREDAILDALAERWPLTVVSQPNGGVGAARNLGISMTSTPYVAMVDADDVLDPDFVARCVALLEHDPALTYASGWAQLIDDHGRHPEAPGLRTVGNDIDALDIDNYAAGNAIVIRRSAFDRVRFAPQLQSFEDWAFGRELAQAGLVGRTIPENLWRYRIRGDSMLRTVGDPNRPALVAAMSAHLREAEIREPAA